MLKNAIITFACAALISQAFTAPAFAERTAEEIGQICAKAEKRYKKYFGKASKEEPFTVVIAYKLMFCPKNVTVKQGTTVRWVNVESGATNHNAWFKQQGKQEPERFFPKEHAEMTFDLPPGDYPYICGPHWETEGMTGKVTVVP